MSRKCKYTREEITSMLEQTPLEQLYQSDVVNYGSDIKDEDTSVMDVVASWLLDGDRFITWQQSVSRYSVRRNASADENAYNIRGKTHYKDPEGQGSAKKQNEVYIAKKLCQAPVELAIGKPLNFEVPLSDNAGQDIKAIADAVDLVTYDEGRNTLNLVELKQPRNTRESLLRCILEVFTYYLLIRDKRFLVREFMCDREGVSTGVRSDARMSVAVLVPPSSGAGKDLREYLQNERCLCKVRLLVAEMEKVLNRDWGSDDLKVRFEFLTR